MKMGAADAALTLATLCVAALGLAGPAAAEVALDFPVDCELGRDCFVQNYVDRDPGPGIEDFACGPLSYDGHKGTDIALPSFAAIDAGVAVRAALAGTVRGVRDGMPDIVQGAEGAPDVAGRECGNGAALDHGGGLTTLYCHLREGSVAVAPGDQVAAGTVLGQIGLSGNTTFPHLHMEVLRNDTPVDPYAPNTAGCGTPSPPEDSLWADALGYVAGGLITSGVATAVPTYDAIKLGLPTAERLAAPPALVVWTFGFGIRAGDRITLSLTGPRGEVFREEILHDRSQAQFYYAWGKRRPFLGWRKGRYLAVATFHRDGLRLGRHTVDLTVD